MKLPTAKLSIVTALLLGAGASMATATTATPSRSTPDSCIELNHGDWNACGVGNGGAGNLPYKRVGPPRTPDECIALNHGDWNACNVGNGGAGDLPYRPGPR